MPRMPLAVICNLVSLTRCSLHVCIPHLATYHCIQSIAKYFRDRLDAEIVIIFWYSNECWILGFPRAYYVLAKRWPSGGTADAMKWYGYRAAQCMKMIRDIF